MSNYTTILKRIDRQWQRVLRYFGVSYIKRVYTTKLIEIPKGVMLKDMKVIMTTATSSGDCTIEIGGEA